MEKAEALDFKNDGLLYRKARVINREESVEKANKIQGLTGLISLTPH
jgi:hypothetical protein